MLDEYVGGHMALASVSPRELVPNSDLLYVIMSKKRDKTICITINGKTGEIESITEQDVHIKDPGGKIIEFRKYMKEE